MENYNNIKREIKIIIIAIMLNIKEPTGHEHVTAITQHTKYIQTYSDNMKTIIKEHKDSTKILETIDTKFKM